MKKVIFFMALTINCLGLASDNSSQSKYFMLSKPAAPAVNLTDKAQNKALQQLTTLPDSALIAIILHSMRGKSLKQQLETSLFIAQGALIKEKAGELYYDDDYEEGAWHETNNLTQEELRMTALIADLTKVSLKNNLHTARSPSPASSYRQIKQSEKHPTSATQKLETVEEKDISVMPAPKIHVQKPHPKKGCIIL